jgi:uncharacterized metal-binding protein YceD (DUF177 family)
MTDAPPEFSRLVAIARLGPEPFRQEIAASEAEREALARRFDLIALGRLTACVELSRTQRDRVLLRAAFAAEFEQSCVVTLEPVPGALAESFSMRFGPPEAEDRADVLADEEIFEPLVGEAIDIGEAVAQQFSLALPPFPRDPAAVVDIAPEAQPSAGPFAVLARLRMQD